MKELKTYISEGFFSNVGADIIIKPVIDAIKNASMNDKVDSDNKKQKFVDSLTPILKDLENNIKKGKIVFEYIRNDRLFVDHKTTISLETSGTGKARWIYSNGYGELTLDAYRIALSIALDLYPEATHPIKDPKLQHSIAKTIKVTEIKLS